MALWLRQTTAVIVPIGPFVDNIDGDSERTALIIAASDVRLKKQNSADAVPKNSGTACTHDERGIYNCPFSTVDTNTLGQLTLFVHVAGALMVRHDFLVLPANVYDSLVLGTDRLEAAASELGAGLITNASIADNAITASKIAADAITATKLAADVATELNAGMATASQVGAMQADVTAIKGKTDSLTLSSAGYVDANLHLVKGVGDTVDRLERGHKTIVLGTCASGASATTYTPPGGLPVSATLIPTASLDPAAAVADQFKGRLVQFAKDTPTAALRGQVSDVLTSTATGDLTVTALTTLPISGDVFVIL